MKIPFFIVDVFAEKRFSGNQLAVVLPSSELPHEQMQEIAREMHFSETTFICPDPPIKNKYCVKIFTPEREVPFAGHPVLGTAFVIREEIMERPVNEIILSLQAGLVPVLYSPEIGRPSQFWMRQPDPIFGKTFDPSLVAKALSLHVSALDPEFPIQEVSTGLPFIIVPVKSRDSVKAAEINRDPYLNLIRDSLAKALFIFCPDPYDLDHTFNARMFGPYYGITEDPATGSASGCLAAYLHKHKYFEDMPPVIVIEQGYEIHRPSLIYGKTNEMGGKIQVEVGGSVIMVARGEMNIRL